MCMYDCNAAATTSDDLLTVDTRVNQNSKEVKCFAADNSYSR